VLQVLCLEDPLLYIDNLWRCVRTLSPIAALPKPRLPFVQNNVYSDFVKAIQLTTKAAIAAPCLFLFKNLGDGVAVADCVSLKNRGPMPPLTHLRGDVPNNVIHVFAEKSTQRRAQNRALVGAFRTRPRSIAFYRRNDEDPSITSSCLLYRYRNVTSS